tara:strand:+ start:4093 stop:4524 length:432 start_codon:yes stop_codon:yes gene_type:complete
MSIEAKAKKIMTAQIRSLSKEYGTKPKGVQLLMKLKGGEPKFFAMHEFKTMREVSVKELYPVLVDLFNVREILPAFVVSLIVDIAEKEDGAKYEDIQVIISTNGDDLRHLYLHAYNKNSPIRQLSWEEVFGNEAMMKLMAKQG